MAFGSERSVAGIEIVMGSGTSVMKYNMRYLRCTKAAEACTAQMAIVSFSAERESLVASPKIEQKGGETTVRKAKVNMRSKTTNTREKSSLEMIEQRRKQIAQEAFRAKRAAKNREVKAEDCMENGSLYEPVKQLRCLQEINQWFQEE